MKAGVCGDLAVESMISRRETKATQIPIGRGNFHKKWFTVCLKRNGRRGMKKMQTDILPLPGMVGVHAVEALLMLEYFLQLDGATFWGLVTLALLAGLALLTYGGDWLADGAASIADHFKIDPIVIGITVVSTATSAPELFTCLIASFTGAEGWEGLILGNILGSNLANVALIMGVAAMVCPIVEGRYVYWEIPWLIVASCLFTWFCFGDLTRMEGGILLVLMTGYMVVTMRIEPFFKGFLGPMYKTIGVLKDPSEVKMVDPENSFGDIEHRPISKSLFLVILGALALMFGARFLVDSAQAMSIKMNVDQGFVGLTLVAIGTSLPELAASIGAARRDTPRSLPETSLDRTSSTCSSWAGQRQRPSRCFGTEPENRGIPYDCSDSHASVRLQEMFPGSP